jgi:hypothetical protein
LLIVAHRVSPVTLLQKARSVSGKSAQPPREKRQIFGSRQSLPNRLDGRQHVAARLEHFTEPRSPRTARRIREYGRTLAESGVPLNLNRANCAAIFSGSVASQSFAELLAR